MFFDLVLILLQPFQNPERYQEVIIVIQPFQNDYYRIIKKDRRLLYIRAWQYLFYTTPQFISGFIPGKFFPLFPPFFNQIHS